jgi:uncharacterized protein YjdB
MKSTRTIILAIALATISCDSTSPIPAGIGTAGGTATSVNNTAKVVIPAGALTSGTTVTVAPASSAPGMSGLVAGAAYEFGPSGTTFAVPVVISITYDPAMLPPNVPESSLQLYTASGSSWVLVPGSSVNTATHTVSGSTTHFSTYAPIGVVSVAQVVLTPTPQPVIVGSTVQLSAQTLDASGGTLQGRTVAWTSSDAAKATVSQSGLVTAVAVGSATITATSEGKTASATVTVIPVPVSTVLVTAASQTITVGSTTTLTATTRDAAGNTLAGRAVTWSLSDATRAVIATDGTLTGLAVGSVTVTATSEGKTGSATITIAQQPVASVAVTAPATVRVGESASLSAQLLASNGTPLSGRTVTWSSSNPAVIVVSAAGVVTGITEGTAVITATAEGKSGSATLSVLDPVGAISVNPTTVTLAVGATTTLVATTIDDAGTPLSGRLVLWSSSDPAKAAVSASGVVTAVAAGVVTITATSEGKSATATITVAAAGPPAVVATIALSPLTTNVTVGATTTLAATLTDANGNVLTGRTIVWSSTDPTKATVNASGVVTGVAPGLVGIIATSEGKTGNAAVTVVAVPVNTVTVAPATSTVYIRYAGSLTATLKDANGNTLSGRVVTWSSSNPAMATVSASGAVTGSAAGTVTITATSEGKSGTATVTIIEAPVTTLTVASAVNNITVGGTASLTADTKDFGGVSVTGRVVTWVSSDPSKATVSATGVVTGVAVGSATITATSEGVSGMATVNVAAATAAATVPIQLLAIATGDQRSCGLNTSGAAYCWGYGGLGLGDGTTHDALSPVAVTGGLTFASIGVHSGLVCGITPAGTLYCWGGGSQFPVLLPSVPTAVAPGITFASVSVNSNHTCGVATDGTGYCAGTNAGGSLGTGQSQGTLAASSTFLAVAGGLHWKQIVTSNVATCGLTVDGAVYCWGNLTAYMSGTGALTSSSTPVPLSSAVTFASLSQELASILCGVSTAGDAYCFGNTTNFVLGGAQAANYQTPTHVGGAFQFKSLTNVNSSLCGIGTNNALYCWGANGQLLGQGATYPTNSATPLVVMSGTSFSAVTGGPVGSACAVTTAGTGYCWGDNFNGELGDGTHANRTALTPILGGITFRVP